MHKMKCFFNLIFLIFITKVQSMHNGAYQSYLATRLEEVKRNLVDVYSYKYRKHDVITSIEPYGIEQFTIPNLPYTFEIYNTTYVLMKNKIYVLFINDNTYQMKAHSVVPNLNEEVLFVKCTVFEDKPFLIIAMSNSNSNIYIYENNKWNFVQTIHTIGHAADANFFLHYNNLYLFVANYHTQSKIPSIVYKWTSVYFDEFQWIETHGAVASIYFEHKDYIILVIAQNPEKYSKVSTIVISFTESGLHKLQYLDIDGPNQIFTYEQNGQRFLFAINTYKNGVVYLWDGFIFTETMNFDTSYDYEVASLYSVADNPMLFIATNHSVIIYNFDMSNAQHVTNLSLDHRYEEVMGINYVKSNGYTFLFVYGLSTEQTVDLTFIVFSVEKQVIVTDYNTILDSDSLLNCLENLDEKIKLRDQILKDLSQKSECLLNEHDQDLGMRSVENERMNEILSTHSNVEKLRQRFENIKQNLSQVIQSIIVTGNLHVIEAEIPSLQVEKINNHSWEPENWLSLNKEQVINAPIIARNLVAKQISIANGSILLEGNQTLNESVNLTSLNVNNMYVDVINEIEFDDVYRLNRPVTIHGDKFFDEITADSLVVTNINGQSAEKFIDKYQNAEIKVILNKQLKVDNLNVEYINNIHWTEFTNSLFKRNENNTIHGDLIINGDVEIENLTLETIHDIPITDLFTKTTDQVITSDINAININVENITSNNINGLDFEKDVVTFDDNNIEDDVSIENIIIRDNLNVSVNIFDEKNSSNEEKLFQTYEGHVKIIGNVTIANLMLNKNNLYINNKSLENVMNQYWLKSVNQTIPEIEVTNSIKISNLHTESINNISMEAFVRIDRPVHLNSAVFHNITAQNVTTTKDDTHKPSIKEILTDTVKKSGSYNITGNITFTKAVIIDHLEAKFLNEIEVTDIVTKNSDKHITGQKTFSKIIVYDDVTLPPNETIIINKLNGINITNLTTNTTLRNKTMLLGNLSLKNVVVDKFSLVNVNGHPMKTITEKGSLLFKNDVIPKLRVSGDLKIGGVVNLTHLNDIDINDFFSKLVRRNTKNIITGKYRFTGKVFVESLHTEMINDVNITDLSQNYLSRSTNQTINNYYYFMNMNCPKISTPKINQFDTSEMIDKINDIDIHIHNNIFVDHLNVEESVHAQHMNYDVVKLNESLTRIPGRLWDIVIIDGNATVHKNTGLLSKVLHDAVMVDANNYITGPVTFDHLSVKKMNVKDNIISGVNITHLMHDALLLNSNNTQIITGKKKITHITCANAVVYKNANITNINDINLLNLRQNLVKLGDLEYPVYGQKTFESGLYLDHLSLPNSKIHGVLPEDLVTINTKRLLPSTHFQHLTINDLYVETLNDFNLTHLMNNRILLKSNDVQHISAALEFNHLVLTGSSKMMSINNVTVDDVIVDSGVQSIYSEKIFLKPVTMDGNIIVHNYNGQNLTRIFEMTLLTNQSDILSEVVFEKPVDFVSIDTNIINEKNVHSLINSLETELTYTPTEDTKNAVDEINFILENAKPMKDEVIYQYLEPTFDVQLSLPNSLEARVEEIQDSTILSVIGQQSGANCDLNTTCPCPLQNSFRFTPQMTFENMIHNEKQRHFTYYSSHGIVNVFTSSVSTSAFCRLQQYSEHELTKIFWTPANSLYPYSFQVFNTGYISGVEFFTNNYVYVIIIRSYDPIKDSNNLECVVVRLSLTEGDAFIIQEIPTQGAEALHLFKTAQGRILIIGNMYDSVEKSANVNTEIYRFDEENEKFNLLSKVPTIGCHSVVGVVIDERDSLIMLAQRHSIVKVLRYDHETDNYVYFQNVRFKYPVLGISAFYVGDVGKSDVFLIITTYNKSFYMYSYKYIEGWKLESNGNIEGLQTLIPFKLNKQLYLFAPSLTKSKILTIIKQG